MYQVFLKNYPSPSLNSIKEILRYIFSNLFFNLKVQSYFVTKFFDKILQVSYKLSWNDNVTFVIEQLQEAPIFCLLQQSENECVVQDFYENQWKNNTLGHSKYSHNPISAHTDRPPYSTLNGRPVLPKSQIMPPTPLWFWIDDWHLYSIPECTNGWIYVDDWKSSTFKQENSTKFRFRKWIRTMALKKVTLLLLTSVCNLDYCQDFVEEDSNNLDFISNHFRLAVDSLRNYMPPFLKALKREVASSPENFDFRSVAAVPSPRLRRELQYLNFQIYNILSIFKGSTSNSIYWRATKYSKITY